MQFAIVVLGLALTTHAFVARDTGCCFHLSAQGGPGGPVEQLADGQNRIGQSGLSEGQYCISTTGGLTDAHGRGCIFTPPTTQWQCDAGASPISGASITASGVLAYNGTNTFYACPTGDHGGFNIYSVSLGSQHGCVAVSLHADNCMSSSPSSAPAPPPKSSCPMQLPANFEFPHLIMPIDSTSADKCFGTSYNGTASGALSSIFNFDIPASLAGKQCSLAFALPMQTQLETSAFSMSGAGVFGFAMLAAAATQQTTYATAPDMKQDFGQVTMTPGNAYNISQFPCPAGQAIGVWMFAVGNSQLNYFQDSNPCPIGLYVTHT